jgi:hypothetical protein
LKEKEIPVQAGKTSVYDVLLTATTLGYITTDIESSFSYGKYLNAINGLYEKSCRNESG